MSSPRSDSRYGLQNLADLVGEISRPFMHKHSLLDERVFKFWQEIVGPELAQHTMPLKLIGQQDALKQGQRQLEILVSPGAALQLTYGKTQLIEKVNRFYGYSFIGNIRIKQGHIPKLIKRIPKPVGKSLKAQEKEWVDTQINTIQDPELQKALRKWGQQIMTYTGKHV